MSATLQEPSAYEQLGGEPTVRALCARLYRLMDELPEARACREIHPPSLERAEEKLYEFLTGWLGGPPLYWEKYGHPQLRRRHFVAEIGPEEAGGWLICFHRAWQESVPDTPLARELAQQIDRLGWHMQNTAPGEPARCGGGGARQQHRYRGKSTV